MSMSSSVLGEADAVAGDEDCGTESLVVDAPREVIDDAGLVGVEDAEEVVVAAWIAHKPLWQVAPGGQQDSPH